MLQNYIKIAFRNILRNKTYSFINIAGLSLGIACCLLLYLYVADELSYDQYHKDLENVYRLDTKFEGVAGFDKSGSVSPPIAMTLRDELPEAVSAVRLIEPPGASQSLIQYNDLIYYESDGYIADSTLFDVLTFELKEGYPSKALTEVNTVILSAKMAKKIFGDQPALDKSILISQDGPAINYKVTGVFRDDQKSFIHPHFITSMMSDGMGKEIRTNPNLNDEWAGQNFIPTFVKLSPGHSKADAEKKINAILLQHGAEDLKALGMKKTLFLEPVKDIYLRSATDASQRITYIYVIVSIAAFILVIACINFMNLATAKATKRATEIGMRKVMGAFRSSLASQILGEAMVIVLLSVAIGIVMVQLALPFFNNLSGKVLTIGSGNTLYFSIALIALALFTGLIAGSYPAFYISSFQPAQVLKGKFSLSSGSGTLRQSLVVFQFVIAIVLVCGMIVISQQLKFMKEKDLGFESEARIVLPLRTSDAQHQYETLRKEIQANSFVKKASGAYYLPGTHILSDMMFYKSGQTMDDAISQKRNDVDFGYMDLLGIKLVAGRAFTENRESESQGKVIVNEKAAKSFGMTPEEIIGQPIYFDWHGKQSSFEVIGVMHDYNQNSLKEKIEPLLFEMPEKAEYNFVMASLQPGNFEEKIAVLQKIWQRQLPGTPFEFSFLDANIQQQYDEDRKVSTIITTFTAIAIAICILGLYGLSSFMAERRFKEIGVRKVMGANVTQIVGMMSKEFIKLVLVAFAIAVPLAWFGAQQWLQSFEYKIPVSIMVFIYAGASALIIALLTVSYESLRAASTNPINSLRNE